MPDAPFRTNVSNMLQLILMKNPCVLPKFLVNMAMLSLTGGVAFAAATATDTAANYTGGWSASTTPNLGSGFGAWNVQAVNNNNPPYSGTYLDLATYGNPDGVLSPGGSGGAAWGTYANGGDGSGVLVMSRAFTAGPSGSSSLYNQTFSVGIGSGGIGGTGSSIVLNIGTAISLTYLGGGADNFNLIVDGGGASVIPVTFANQNGGLLIALSVSGPLNSATENYTLALSPFAGGSPYYTTSGTFNSAAFNTASFTFYDYNTSNDQFVNNPNISAEGSVPEPSTLALSALSGLAMLIVARKRK